MLHFFARRLRDMQEVRRDERGFTLIELLVVVIIIAILAAIAIPVYLNQTRKAEIAKVKSDVRNAVTMYTASRTDTDPANDIGAGAYTQASPMGSGDTRFAPSANVTITIATAAGVTTIKGTTSASGLGGYSYTYNTDTGEYTEVGA
jgi:type IV pilus assembly protein PilA